MNQPKGSLFDEYPRLGQFVEAMKKRHPEMNNVQCKNLYLIQTEDVDGNIIDEKYGVNLMTDVGADALDGYYKYTQSYTHIAFITLYDTAPEHGIQYEDVDVNSTPTNSDGKLYSQFSRSETIYAMTYDSTSGMLSQAIRIGYASFNYNQGNLTEPRQIKRISIPSYMIDGKWTTGSEVTINDIDALPSNIIKRPNEKLTVYAFWVGSIHKSVIEKAWDNGIYTALSPGMFSSGGAFQDFYLKRSNSYYFTNRLEGYSGYDLSGTNSDTEQSNSVPTGGYGFGSTSSGNQDHVHEYDLTQYSSFLFTDPRFYISRTRLCCNYYDIRFDIFKQERLPSPEEIVSEEVYTNRSDSPLISNTFGRYKNNRNNVGILPVIDFSISSVKGFNYLTKDWDIDINFIDNPNAVYDNTFNKNTAINISGQGSTVYVYVNAHNDVPITKFTTSDFSSKPSGNIYATDEYWDTSTWTQIPDAFDIPQALRTKKYYIKTGGHTGIMEPVYDQTVHQLNVGTSNNLGANMPTNLPQYYCVRPITSESKEWILGQEHLLFMDTTTNTVTSAHQLYGDANNSRIDPCLVRYGFDDYVVVTPGTYSIPANVRIYEIGNAAITTFTDIPLTWTTPNRVGHYSSTQNGYVVIHNECDHMAYVIDVANQTATPLPDVSICTAIEGTNYCVYKVPDSSPQQFVIYNMNSKNPVRTFELPTGYKSLSCIIGLRNYIYIRDDTNSTQTVFLYRIQENSLIQTNMNFGSLYLVSNPRTQDVSTNILATDRLRPQLYRVKLIVHNDGFVWMRNGYISSYVAYDEPEKVRDLFKDGDYSEKYVSDGISTYERYFAAYLGYSASIYKTSDQKHLLLIDPASPFWYRSDEEFSSGRVLTGWGDNSSTKIVTDLGHIFTVKTYQNECTQHAEHWEGDSNKYNAMAYWNNGIIIFHYNGDSKWYPLDWFLPHKVTGTTYTIQSYNNPKSINGKQMMIYYTNRGDIVDTDPSTPPYTPSKIGGFIWTKDVPLGENYFANRYYATLIANNLSRLDTNHIVLTNGQQISVSIVGAGDYANETFTWRIRGWNRSGPDSGSYIGPTFDSGYLSSGGVYTVNTAAGCKSASIIIQCTEHDWLMPYNIANVTITIDGQTFPST